MQLKGLWVHKYMHHKSVKDNKAIKTLIMKCGENKTGDVIKLFNRRRNIMHTVLQLLRIKVIEIHIRKVKKI